MHEQSRAGRKRCAIEHAPPTSRIRLGVALVTPTCCHRTTACVGVGAHGERIFHTCKDADMHTHFCDAACTARDCVWHPGSTALVHSTAVWFLNTRKADREPTCAWAIHARSHARKHAGIAGCGRGLHADRSCTRQGGVCCAHLATQLPSHHTCGQRQTVHRASIDNCTGARLGHTTRGVVGGGGPDVNVDGVSFLGPKQPRV
jgi:hypothetical protein